MVISQRKDESEYKIKFSGYINWTAVYDSRQTVCLREGHFLLFPANKVFDINGNDINDNDNLNMLAIQTRLNTRIDGPEVLGAKPTGFIEAEFFGTAESDVNGFRLRHAYLNLDWGSTSLLVGQTWHPMFIAEAFPQVISFNTGVPFQPFSRNPQIKLSHRLSNTTVSITLSSQRDFTSLGPSGATSAYLRNSGLPAVNINVQSKFQNVLFGGGLDFKTITPRIVTSQNVAADEKISSLSGLAYLKYSDSHLSFIAQGVYGQNLSDLMMLGGYAVKNTEPTTGREEYMNVNVYSVWTDLTYGKDLQPGIFIGYSKNLGADEIVSGPIFSRASNIGELLRISPRILYSKGKLKLGTEIEFTKAFYGLPDNKAKIQNKIGVLNTRVLIGMFYII